MHRNYYASEFPASTSKLQFHVFGHTATNYQKPTQKDYIGYVRDSERETYFILKKEWGEMSNSKLDKYMRESIVVKGEQVIKKISGVWFYDSKPDTAYTMSILWGQIFPDLIPKNKHLSTRGRKAIDHSVDIDAIMAKINESPGRFFYPPKRQ